MEEFYGEEDYVVMLRAECGEEIELWEPKVTRILMYCDACKESQVFSVEE